MQALVFLLFVGVINVGVCHECAPDWLHFQGHCYGYGDTVVSWGNAQAICQSQNATLAEIPTHTVNNFLTTLARHKGDNCVWLGGNDIFHEGVWEWSSRRNAFYSFTNWHSSEPSNNNVSVGSSCQNTKRKFYLLGSDILATCLVLITKDEDCLDIYKDINYNWDDGSCNYNCNFICEAPVGARG